MAGAGVGFKDDQEQWKRPLWLVAVQLVGGWPQGVLLTWSRSAALLAIAGVVLGSAWSSLANHCRRERRGVGVPALWSVLQCSEMCFQARGIPFPPCLPLCLIRGLGVHQAKQAGMESLQETQHFPLASPVAFTFFLSLCSNFYWQPSLPVRAEMLRLGITLESVEVQIGCSHCHWGCRSLLTPSNLRGVADLGLQVCGIWLPADLCQLSGFQWKPSSKSQLAHNKLMSHGSMEFLSDLP